MNKVKKVAVRISNIVSAPRFLWVIVGLLVVQALWIALTGRYPMAFDEDFHIGVIKLYADHLNPFWTAHPAGADTYGAITRDPSYLYHYLMSFPYRSVRLFTDSLSIQVLVLRFINIALFASGIPLYAKLLRRFQASRLTIHTALLLFILVPIVPMLAAQVNYDNLILPLTALSLLLTLKVSESLRADKFNMKALLQLFAVCAVSSLVKYAYLPICIAIIGFLLVRAFQVYRTPRSVLKVVPASWRASSSVRQWLVVVICIVMTVLLAERYAVNVIRYHTPVPDCAQVLVYDQCQHYGPWIRDYNLAKHVPDNAERSPIAYTQHWLYGMWFRSFFAVDGPRTGFQTRGPLTLPATSAIVLAVMSGAAILISFRALLRRYNTPAIYLFVSATVVYTVVLWLTEYQLFLETGKPVAINGRYMLLLLPGIFVLSALAIRQVTRKLPYASVVIAVLAIVCFAWGGGTATYIIRSNDAWYWPNTPMTTANHAVQDVLRPITPGASAETQYIH